MIAKTPHQLFQWAVDSELVYCGGRGEGVLVEGKPTFLATKRAIRHRGDDKAKAGFHCSSWTNFALAYFTGCHPMKYTPRGTMPSLFDLCEKGDFMYNPYKNGKPQLNRPVPIHGYGDFCAPLSAKSYADLLESDLEGFDLVILGESTLTKKGKWKWWHHTAAVARHDWNGTLLRCAADGYKEASGRYSMTPMDIEVVDEDFAKAKQGKKLVRAFGVSIVPPQFELAKEL